MPTYDYTCTHCTHQFEQFQPITAAPLRDCPKCGRRKLRRLIGTGGGVLFRGSGFYQTDYRSESYKKAAEAESKAAAGSSKDNASRPADGKPAEAGNPKPQTQAEGRPARRKRSS